MKRKAMMLPATIPARKNMKVPPVTKTCLIPSMPKRMKIRSKQGSADAAPECSEPLLLRRIAIRPMKTQRMVTEVLRHSRLQHHRQPALEQVRRCSKGWLTSHARTRAKRMKRKRTAMAAPCAFRASLAVRTTNSLDACCNTERTQPATRWANSFSPGSPKTV